LVAEFFAVAGVGVQIVGVDVILHAADDVLVPGHIA